MAGLREELLDYYERELTYIRQMGGEWARKYPKLAGRLMMEPERCEDPHVERLIEAFALLAARVHLKIDDDFPEISTALLEMVYPHYVRPIPSMSVVEFQLSADQGKRSAGLTIPRGSALQSNRVNNTVCKFRTTWDTTLWPFKVVDAKFRTAEGLFHPSDVGPTVAAVTITLACPPDVAFKSLECEALRFHIAGEGNVVSSLYELFCRNCVGITAQDVSEGFSLKPVIVFSSRESKNSTLRPVGFREDEGALPYSGRSFLGYRTLQEYFSFPEKFHFFELSGLDLLRSRQMGTKIQLTFLLSRFERPERFQVLEMGVSAKTFRLGCTPIINLFAKSAEPVQVTGAKAEYPVVPDLRTQGTTEVYSIDEVTAQEKQERNVIHYHPFYSTRHQKQDCDGGRYWFATRRSSELYEDAPTQMLLSVVDTSGSPVEIDADALLVRCSCTNGNLPSKLSIGQESGDFELEGFPAVNRITALRRPTPSLPPPIRKEVLWKLISQLSLNHLSLVSEGKEALQQILLLHNFAESVHLRNQVQGIMRVESKRQNALLMSEDGGPAFARGVGVEIELDEEQFAGGGAYLFAAVLEHFLSQHVTLNSFTQLTAYTRQRKEVLGEWPPRSGSWTLA